MAGKLKSKLIDTAGSIDGSAELIAGHARLELIGNGRLMIENHKGIIEYGRERISVLTSGMTVIVTGVGLEISAMNDAAILLTGAINGLELTV